MVCLSEEGAIIKEPPSQRKEKLAPWERRKGKKSIRHTTAAHRMDSEENTLGRAHLGTVLPC